MNISIFIASLALIYATASPIDNVIPEETLIDNQYIDPDYEAHATAQRKVDELLESGRSDADCRKVAKATADDVTKSVAAQQAALNKMSRGSQCNTEGSSLIAAAEKSKSTAESNLKSIITAKKNAKAKTFNFGDFSYNSLTEGQCGTFFNSAQWKSAKASVAATNVAHNKAEGEMAQAKKDLADTKATAAKMVTTCKCSVKKLHAKTVTDLNSSVNAANMKAWKLAAHLVCILDHKTTNQCTVPTLPTVKAVTLDAGVAGACAATSPTGGTLYAGNKCSNGPKFSLMKVQTTGKMSAAKFNVCNIGNWKPLCDYASKHMGGCIWPTGCKNHWHNWRMPSEIGLKRHKNGGGPLAHTCAIRSDGGANDGGAACTFGLHTPGSLGTWASGVGGGQNLAVMCVKYD